MNKHSLDNLFKEKLESHKMTPPEDAWSKLQEGLNQHDRKIKFVYWKVAAIIILLAGLTFIAYQFNGQGQKEIIAESNTPTLQTDPILENTDDSVAEVAVNSSEKVKEVNSSAENVEGTSNQSMENDNLLLAENELHQTDNEDIKVIETNPINTDTKEILIADATSDKDPASTIQNNITDQNSNVLQEQTNELPMEQTVDLAVVAENNSKEEVTSTKPNIVITFIAGDNKETPVDETQKKKKFGFKNMLAKASEFKNGDLNFASIRDKKDELLTLNLGKNKNEKDSK